MAVKHKPTRNAKPHENDTGRVVSHADGGGGGGRSRSRGRGGSSRDRRHQQQTGDLAELASPLHLEETRLPFGTGSERRAGGRESWGLRGEEASPPLSSELYHVGSVFFTSDDHFLFLIFRHVFSIMTSKRVGRPVDEK